MKYTSIEKEQWLYQKPNTKYYDCGIRAVLNAYMFWNGYDKNIKQKLCYYRKKYGPYTDGCNGETTPCEIQHLAYDLNLSMAVIPPNITGINGMLRYNLPVLFAGCYVKSSGNEYGHSFLVIPGSKAINLHNKPVETFDFEKDIVLPNYENGKPWQTIFTVIPNEYSLKRTKHLVSIHDKGLFRIISETIYKDGKYI